MMPIYYAMTLERSEIPGGTTLPCQMRVVNSEGNKGGIYVVKVFSQKHIRQYNPTNKEIIANLLAQEFELDVPDLAVVYVGKEIIDQLQAREAYKKLELKSGYYFGCKYEEGCVGYSNDIKLSTYETWELETIFAFDLFICNRDRRLGKPNILFRNGAFILIDHDLALDVHKTFFEYKEIGFYEDIANGANVPNRKHIFLDHLKKLAQQEEIAFDDFIENLRSLDLKRLNNMLNPLRKLEFDFSDFDEYIFPYLVAIKQNSSDFQKLLKSLLLI